MSKTWDESVVALYADVRSAKAAIKALKSSPFPSDQVSLVAKSLEDEEELHGFVQHGDRTEKDSAKGAGIGGLLGFLVGAAFLWVPGIGPLVLAGPIATGLTGGIVGALVGAMSGWGIPEDRVAEYEEKVRAGAFMVVAHGHAGQVGDAYRLLETTEPEEIHLHSAAADSPEIEADTTARG